ncbi:MULTISPECIES: rodlin [Streptomycetaceae]|uniref:RdlB protein n=1 Tax=Streptantibioticus cattleyicolor (strain ATCC 35852 / DSM 46488 / JCM 4925 / NBRC 14057 / NRRL 8057) TaxID=1003195 RepID=F8JNX4_STREN|nr:rodlin [Streptantibioticus cattleyicolor]AEW93914.1 RdlB protein [Streptantibioticus cattleyicolor NRRL 8057 = DSM 46488]MYS58592.1 RdlA protein [Streptomyces sp. SID5468]CCB74261.1 RdlB protein [Streptantibioticus cattleyicolor NRRL 8057 = DSM 46488]
MIKKILATAAVVVSAVGATSAPAMAIGNGHGHGSNSANGNGSGQVYGNTTTGGYMSPQIGLVQGSLNKPCIGIPIKDIQVPILQIVAIQDLLNQHQTVTCTENTNVSEGDAPLSHILDNIPILSRNGAGNR